MTTLLIFQDHNFSLTNELFHFRRTNQDVQTGYVVSTMISLSHHYGRKVQTTVEHYKRYKYLLRQSLKETCIEECFHFLRLLTDSVACMIS